MFVILNKNFEKENFKIIFHHREKMNKKKHQQLNGKHSQVKHIYTHTHREREID